MGSLARQVVDTSVVIGFLRGHPPAVSWVQDALRRRRAVLSVVTVFELELGVAPGSRRQEELHRLFRHLPILPLDGRAALLAAQLERKLRGEGLSIGPADVFIAATCLAHRLPLVTQNAGHFKRIPDLTVITF